MLSTYLYTRLPYLLTPILQAFRIRPVRYNKHCSINLLINLLTTSQGCHGRSTDPELISLQPSPKSTLPNPVRQLVATPLHRVCDLSSVDLQLCTNFLGIAVASYNLGCFFGAIFCIWIGNYLGRRKTIFTGSIIMVIGATLQACAYSSTTSHRWSYRDWYWQWHEHIHCSVRLAHLVSIQTQLDLYNDEPQG